MSVTAWKHEFVGKRRIELAETVLALFYEAEDAIREIRSPFSFVGEGSSRKRSEGERQEESQLLDQAYVVFERYQKREKLFAELKAMRYRCMASFGQKAAEPFDEISKILHEIFVSARMLGSHYWPRQGRAPMSDDEFQKHLEQMEKHEAVYWYMGEDKDEISPRVKQAVSKMEKIAQGVILSYPGPGKSLFSRGVQWFRSS
ncbi:MAG: hypothetical protein M1356_03920 [Gammaproteobacteria bacterium]|nr:hypothetical protein [Gammaproteobacteria bacterium]